MVTDHTGELSLFETFLRSFDNKPNNQRDYALLMLVHDWSQDTIWVNLSKEERTEAIQNVLDAQIEAILAINTVVKSKHQSVRGASIRRIMSNFVEQSKLSHYAELAKGQ